MKGDQGLFSVPLERCVLDLERLRRSREGLVNQMVQSLVKQGQLTPIMVTPGLMVVDGFKRVRAARILGWGALEALGIEADVRTAKALVYLMNRAGGFSMIQEALLVKELVEIDGLTQAESAILLGRHKSWVSRRLEMIRRLLPEVIENLVLELIPGGVGPSLARIPPCNQADFSAVIQRHHLTPGEIHRLADLFCKASDPGIRQAILQSPREALNVVQRQLQNPGIDWAGKIQLMLRIVTMLERALSQKKFHVRVESIGKLSGHLDQIKPILTEILFTIQKEA